MERSEPALVPEWLKSSGSVSASGSSNHQLAPSSSLHSDNHSVQRHTRNKLSVSNDHDIGRASVLDRTTSAYFRRSSSANGSSQSRGYSSFAKSHRDRDWEKDINGYHDKDKSILGDHRHRDYTDSLDSLLPSMFEKDVIRRSQSMVTGQRGDTWPRKVASDLSTSNKSNHSNANGLLGGGSNVVIKSAFERDFPSLGAEERQVGSEIGRVSSPGLVAAIQGLSPGISAVTSSEGWTSALAEVPPGMASSSTSGAAAQQSLPASSAPMSQTITSGLNMAETVAQGPSRARTPPVLNVGTQRLEELVIKQSRQLIPMTPSTPKTSLVSPSEKSKSKIGQQQYLSSSLNNSRVVAARSDGLKPSNESRLRILKPSRDLNNGVPSSKDSLSPTSGSKLVNSPLSLTTSTAASTSLRSSINNPNFASIERNPTPLRVTIEKRQTAQAQSRNDFFNLLKKKSSLNSPSAASDPGPSVSPSVSEKPDEHGTADASMSATLQSGNVPLSETSDAGSPTDNRREITHDLASYYTPQQCSNSGDKHSSSNLFLCPDEEEAAFLRSLGWEESSGEDEGLTEEEISAFYKEYMKLRPSAKLLQGMQAEAQFNSYDRPRGGASSGLSSSDTDLDT